MKNNKKLLGLILCLVCVMICMAAVLTGCGDKDDPQPSTTPTATVESTADVTETTATPTQQTTVPTEETTAPSTEATTAPTTGNSRPGGSDGIGGSGGLTGGTEETQPTTEATEPVWEVAEPGTDANPYLEVVELPSAFTTVNIPAQGKVVYHVYGAANGVLTIEDAAAVVTFAEAEYKAEEGAVTLEIPKDAQEPLILTFGNVSEEEKVFEVAFNEAFGAESNPYIIELESLPATVETPEIPAGETVYFSVNGAANAMLTLENENVSVVYNDATYLPEEGVVTVQLTADQPALLAIVNGGDAAAVYTMQFAATEADDTPVMLEELGELTVDLVAEDLTGNFYQWTSTGTGLFSVEIVSSTTKCNMILQNMNTGLEAVYSIDAQTHPVTGVTKLSMFANTGDVIQMQVFASQDREGNIPACQAVVYTVLEGTEENPIQEFYPGFKAKIPAGMTLYFQSYRLTNITATVSGGDFTIVHAGETFQTVNGTVSFPVVCENMFTPSVFAITNNGVETAVCTVVFAFPEGAYDNPRILTVEDLAEITVETEAGNDQGYYLQWTATQAGTISFQMQSVLPAGHGYDVILTSSASYAQFSMSESADGVVSMEVQAGDVVTIHVSIAPDQYYNYPAATFVMTGEFKPQ